MPVEFLTPEQRQGYGRYAGEPAPEQLVRFFHLYDAEHELIALRRGDHHRLGFAVQLCTARFLGTFLDDVREAPAGVVLHLARQLGLLAATVDLGLYGTSNHRWEHRAEIRRRGGYREFSTEPTVRFALSRWLYALCWTGTERPGVLFERATAWLLSRKVLLPGVTVLERLIVGVRQRVDERLWRRLAGSLDPVARAKLEGLLDVPEGSSRSLLDRLRSGPTRRSAPELVRALERLEAVRALGIHVSTAARAVPPGRVLTLARFAATAKVTAMMLKPTVAPWPRRRQQRGDGRSPCRWRSPFVDLADGGPGSMSQFCVSASGVSIEFSYHPARVGFSRREALAQPDRLADIAIP